MGQAIKSRERVYNYGEVFTSDELVEDMLQLAPNELCRIDSRYLEPACGTGNFLEPILIKKLNQAKKYKRIIREYEQQSLMALGSIYGIELLKDNVEECRDRLFQIWLEEYRATFKNKVVDDVIKSARFIVDRNIVCANALTMKNDLGEPIVFSEWSIIMHGKMQRKEFLFDEQLDSGETELRQYVCDYRRIWEDAD